MDHDTLLRYLRASDVFVLNTKYEGLSHQILEALALEVPVLTTRVGGNTEVIVHKENGLLVSFNDIHALKEGMSKLLSDDEVRNSLVLNGKEKLKMFDRQTMIASTVSALALH